MLSRELTESLDVLSLAYCSSRDWLRNFDATALDNWERLFRESNKGFIWLINLLTIEDIIYYTLNNKCIIPYENIAIFN